jgi:hypothetical protein
MGAWTGSSWKDLPPCYPPHQTWVMQGVFKQILTELVEDLYRRGAIDIRETLIDDSFTILDTPSHNAIADDCSLYFTYHDFLIIFPQAPIAALQYPKRSAFYQNNYF